jgi:signal transduction histidine kinase
MTELVTLPLKNKKDSCNINATSPPGGSGLGLTIVKRIVKFHHWSIELTSDPGQWVRIQVVLPSSPLQVVK